MTTWGGKREGAGRKPNAEKYALQIESATDQIYDRLSDNIASLQARADHDLIVVHEEWAPAGTVTIKDVEIDSDGKVHRIERPAFPHLNPTELVLVKRRTVNNGPSETALIHLIEHGLGKPKQATELTGKDGGPVETTVMTLDEWKAEAAARRAQAEHTLALAPECDEDRDA